MASATSSPVPVAISLCFASTAPLGKACESQRAATHLGGIALQAGNLGGSLSACVRQQALLASAFVRTRATLTVRCSVEDFSPAAKRSHGWEIQACSLKLSWKASYGSYGEPDFSEAAWESLGASLKRTGGLV